MNNKKEGLWNRNFFLLWQGQLVSSLGDIVYEIALGFWVLAVTGSPALMGTLMAASILPRVIIGPLGGVWVDRSDRKLLIVLMDAARGIIIVLIGVLAVLGKLEIWMVFTAGIIKGIGAAVFNPALSSVIPDVVKKERLMQANSAFSIIRAGSGLIGNSAGGFLFAVIGAPLLFLINGLCYIFSAITEIFIRVPKLPKPEVSTHILSDLKAGLVFTWENKGLRFLMICGALINFFACIGFILFLPLFQQNPELGPGKYGLLMAAMTLGMLGGMALTSAASFKGQKRYSLFITAALLMCVAWAFVPLSGNFPLMIILSTIGGFCNAIINVFIQTIMQLWVPQTMRGKVFGLVDTLFAGLTPVAMAVGGMLGEFFSIKWVIALSFGVLVLIMLPMLWVKDFKDFILFEPAEEKIEEIPDTVGAV